MTLRIIHSPTSKFLQRGTIGHFQTTVASSGAAATWSMAGFASSYTDQAPATQTYEIQIFFQVDATVDVFRLQGSDFLDEVDTYVTPANQNVNTWVRCTFNSGTDMTSGAARGVWHRLDSSRSFNMTYASSGGFDQITGNFDFELSSDSSGTPVVAQALSRVITVGEIA